MGARDDDDHDDEAESNSIAGFEESLRDALEADIAEKMDDADDDS